MIQLTNIKYKYNTQSRSGALPFYVGAHGCIKTIYSRGYMCYRVELFTTTPSGIKVLESFSLGEKEIELVFSK